MQRLTPAARLIVVGGALTNIGTFGVAPFLAVLMVRLDYTAAEVALVLGANLVAARLLPLAAGLLGDRAHHVRVMIVGLAVRGLGLTGFALNDDVGWFLVCSALVGIGGAGYEPNAYAVLAAEPDEQRRARGYTLLNLGQNIGATAGPLIGGALVVVDSRALFLVAGALMFATALAFAAQRRHLRTTATDAPVHQSLRRVFTNGRFLRFGAAMGLFWFVDAQFQTSLPIYAADLSGRLELAGTVLVVNGLAGLVALLLLRRQFERRPALSLSATGFAVVAVSMAAIALVPQLWWLLACVAVYTVGETLVFVTADIYIAEVADTRDAAAFFGGHDVFWAVGGTIGYFAGTALIGNGGPGVWLVFAFAALLGYTLLIRDRRRAAGGPDAGGVPTGQPGDSTASIPAGAAPTEPAR
ncbi:MFS transporter [Micromonospora profundi]|uniref:MFS transporter n=1 Tax=Micromonospora profundi TaxID=1420889 RepID=UPI00364AE5AF